MLNRADGVVLEEGTHDQLVSKHGAYHTMVQSQQHSQSDNNGQVTEPSISECNISEKISLKINDEKCCSSETIISFDDDGSTKRGFEPPLTTSSAKPMSTLMVLQRMIMICRPELPWIILGLASESLMAINHLRLVMKVNKMTSMLASAIIGGSTCAEALLFAHIVSALSMTDTPDLMRSQVAYFSMCK
jgi:ATP-binding cassette subfamily B (MDR/TAP) protein 1